MRWDLSQHICILSLSTTAHERCRFGNQASTQVRECNAGASSSQMMQGKPARAIALSWKSGVAVAVQPQLSSQPPFRQGVWVCAPCGEGDARMAGFQRGYSNPGKVFRPRCPGDFSAEPGKGIRRSGVWIGLVDGVGS
jgi:hypothetical protein